MQLEISANFFDITFVTRAKNSMSNTRIYIPKCLDLFFNWNKFYSPNFLTRLFVDVKFVIYRDIIGERKSSPLFFLEKFLFFSIWAYDGNYKIMRERYKSYVNKNYALFFVHTRKIFDMLLLFAYYILLVYIFYWLYYLFFQMRFSCWYWRL